MRRSAGEASPASKYAYDLHSGDENCLVRQTQNYVFFTILAILALAFATFVLPRCGLLYCAAFFVGAPATAAGARKVSA